MRTMVSHADGSLHLSYFISPIAERMRKQAINAKEEMNRENRSRVRTELSVKARAFLSRIELMSTIHDLLSGFVYVTCGREIEVRLRDLIADGANNASSDYARAGETGQHNASSLRFERL